MKHYVKKYAGLHCNDVEDRIKSRIDNKTNFGSIDGDCAAAMRYTESRLTPISMEMLRDINKNPVIDEAHMYRGSSGGEVALLIRRVLHKLGIGRDRVQFILTSASVPKENEDEVRTFACDLSAQDEQKNAFIIIRGTEEQIALDGKEIEPDVLLDYDVDLLQKTLQSISSLITNKNIAVHYAIKANFNKKLLTIISSLGFGVDCVSKGEIKVALESGFPNSKIIFAGVGKTDDEINYAIDQDIYCFNVESIPELEVIDLLAKEKRKIVNIAFRINPNIQAHTHSKITTGLNENKFGISLKDIYSIIDQVVENNYIKM